MTLLQVYYNSRTLLQVHVVRNINHHEAMITDIIETDEPKCIGTSSMDGNIKLYSMFLEKTYSF